VDRLIALFGVSERRACRVVGQHRSTQRLPRPTPGEVEQRLRTRLRQLSKKHPRWGWRKAHAIVRAEMSTEQIVVNKKRTRRLWREEGLKRPPNTVKKRRVGPQRGDRLEASRPDEVWALDFQYDVTADGRQLRFLNVIDEFTREAFATRAARSFTADATVAVLESVIAKTGRWPAHIRMDNGTELTAHAMRDWCRLSGIETAFIEPGSPWQNGFAESFNGRFRDEFLICEQFDTLLEAQVLAEDWRIEYNSYRPHSSLGDLTPEAFKQQWTTTQPALS
jgi:putative transposase